MMRPKLILRALLTLGLCTALALGLCIALVPGCGWFRGPEDITDPVDPSADVAPSELRNEIPPEVMSQALAVHFAGLGNMERFEYDQAAREFRKVRELAPGWIPGWINLAIALLNSTGVKLEEAREEGQAPPPSNFDEALALLDGVLEADPENLHAHFSRGIILEQEGQIQEAHEAFKTVTERDPTDGHAWFWLGSTLTDSGGMTASIEQADELIEIFEQALECNPYLVPALYRLQQAYGWAGEREKQRDLIQRWQQLNPETQAAVPGPGDDLRKAYGLMGKYASVVGPSLPLDLPAGQEVPPRFEPLRPLNITLPEGHRWATAEDFQETFPALGRARERFGIGIAIFDADGDGKLDLYLTAAVVGPEGVRDALLRNLGDGQFEDVTEAVGLPLNRAGIGVAAGDFDADRNIDLYLTGIGDNRLFRNTGQGGFEDITEETGTAGAPAVSITARWLDLDQDGDLDLYVVNYCSIEHAPIAFTDEIPPGTANAAYRNDGKPEPASGTPASWAPLAVESAETNAVAGLSIELTPWDDAPELAGGDQPSTAIAALDIDDDRDLDLVLAADGEPLTLILNDRLGRFHVKQLDELEVRSPISGLLVGDFDRNGLPDLAAVGVGDTIQVWTNLSRPSTEGAEIILEPWSSNARAWRSATLADLDLDGWVDLVGLPSPSADVPEWTRNEGKRLDARPVPVASEATDLGPLQGVALADLVGNPLPDLFVFRDGDGPMLAENIGNNHNWLAIDLGGRWGIWPKLMRTNAHGLGTKLYLEGQGIHVPYEHTTQVAGTGQSVSPFVLGLKEEPIVPLIRLRWPDGVIQAEMNEKPNQLLELAEYNRKTGSCPVLFTWNGERFVCIGDFIGGGGLGYLVAPGVYAQPDRDEAMHITTDQLQADRGVYRLSVTEPMDEIAYIDKLTLDVVDRPPGIEAHPDERFAPGGNRPTGELIAWEQTIEPVQATDLNGNDVTETLRHFDRDTVDTFRLLPQWIGYAEEHGIILDFGERLRAFGPDDSLVLCIAGWVEYPYSQTNYAASTAGETLQPPVLERRRDDGSWEIIESDPGYPAGLPRMTTLDLTGKLTGDSCVLRIRTNMQCYWDQAFLAVREPDAGLRVTSLEVARAELRNRGYTREVSPDGRLPLLYDYAYVDPAPLAPFSGKLTRYGDVAELLREDDDLLCLVGPGDEIRIEFDADIVPELPEGWTRSYVLRAIGYCKDADPFTALSDTVGPLPWKGMPEFPFGPEGERPRDPEYDAYLRTYQTRPAGGR